MKVFIRGEPHAKGVQIESNVTSTEKLRELEQDH